MLDLRYARAWRAASIALLLGVLVATLMPVIWFDASRTQVAGWLAHVDKWTHLLAFVVLTVWFAGLYRRRSYWRVALGLLAFGALIELCQRAVGYRSAEWLDLAADAAGILAGLGIAWAGAGGWCQRVEAWFAARTG